MIYLREKGIIFLKPRKVAGTSFEIALSKFARNEDILTRIEREDEKIRINHGFRSSQNYKKKIYEWNSRDLYSMARTGKPTEKFYNHISAKEVRYKITEKKFDSEYKISIIRNPYEMIVSLYFWENRKNDEPEPIDVWLRNNPAVMRTNYDQYYINGNCIIDYFIRYENFEEDIIRLECAKSLEGLWDTFKNINAKGGVRPKSATVYDALRGSPEAVEAIKFFNKEIIERFNCIF